MKTAPYDAEYASFSAKMLDVFDVVEETKCSILKKKIKTYEFVELTPVT